MIKRQQSRKTTIQMEVSNNNPYQGSSTTDIGDNSPISNFDAASSVLTPANQNDRLSPEHRQMLEVESGIAADVIEEAGCYTAYSPADVDGLGFASFQSKPSIFPALILPSIDVWGNRGIVQMRPDNPRVSTKGERRKPIKYETPKGATLKLATHSRSQEHLTNREQPLFMTEGIKKMMALVSHGGVATALIGTTGYRTTNENGGKTILPDFEQLALNGRTIYLVFDSDWRTNKQVKASLLRLKNYLVRRDAHVLIIDLPPTENGHKQGADDFLLHHSLDQMVALTIADHEIPSNPPKYIRLDGKIFEQREDSSVPLSNFDAEITEDIEIRDLNGAVIERHIKGIVRFENQNIHFNCGSHDDCMLRQIRGILPARAVIYAQRVQSLANAIRTLSDPVSIVSCNQIGWAKVEGRNGFVHAGGVIGVEVDDFVPPSDDALSRFVLPKPPSGDDLKNAIDAEIRWLDTAEYRVTIPLLATVFRAPLGTMDSSVLLAGSTGTGKSEQAAIAMAHVGAGWNARNLQSWGSTTNYITSLISSVSGVPLVIDELLTHGDARQVAQQQAKFDSVFRGVGNGQGRGRMNSDRTLSTAKGAGCVVIATGEEIPHGHSLRARFVAVDVAIGDVKFDRLAPTQADARNGVLASTMSAYLHWLAPKLEEKRNQLNAFIREVQSQPAGSQARTPHPRMATNYANLVFGFNIFLEFAKSTGFLTIGDAERWKQVSGDVLRTVIGEQNELVAQENPADIFFDLLRSAISSGRAHVAVPGGRSPDDLSLWGWQRKTLGHNVSEEPKGKCIGYLVGDELWLDPTVSHRVAQEAIGGSSLTNKGVIVKSLCEAGWLLRQEAGRNTYHVRCRRKDIPLQKVLVMSAERFLGDDSSEPDATVNNPIDPSPDDVGTQHTDQTAQSDHSANAENDLSGIQQRVINKTSDLVVPDENYEYMNNLPQTQLFDSANISPYSGVQYGFD